jgi:hypothetical protein
MATRQRRKCQLLSATPEFQVPVSLDIPPSLSPAYQMQELEISKSTCVLLEARAALWEARYRP